jgi:hypothetical protein
MGKTDKPPPIFIAKIDNFSSLSQLQEIAIGDYEITNTMSKLKSIPKALLLIST